MIIGVPAPAFTAQGLVGGQKVDVSLQDYLGQWVILFFYSGDFTFV